MARIFQFQPHLFEADAIGNTVRALHAVLRRAGHSPFMVCKVASPRGGTGELHYLPELLDLRWRPDDLLILHHSFHNPDLAALLALPVRKVLVYHNVTPARFFREHDMPGIGEAADAARRQLNEIASAVQVGIGDSEYNRVELAGCGFRETATIPVFYDDAFFADRTVDWPFYAEIREAAAVNIVFVGRFVPNKRIDRLFEVAAEYAALFGRMMRVHLIGKNFDDTYTASLMAKAAELRVIASLRLHVDAAPLRLKTLLAAADAFICFSEHEGFMVPLVEAFATGCPVIARRAAAVGETMGGAGLALDDPEPALVAGLVELLRRDRDTRRSLQRDQFRRAEHFRTEVTAQRWLALLQREFDLAPRPPC